MDVQLWQQNTGKDGEQLHTPASEFGNVAGQQLLEAWKTRSHERQKNTDGASLPREQSSRQQPSPERFTNSTTRSAAGESGGGAPISRQNEGFIAPKTGQAAEYHPDPELELAIPAEPLSGYNDFISQPSANVPKMSVFDFAGQHMYHQMAQVFIRPKLSMYLPVLDLSKDPDAKLEAEDSERPLTQLQDLIWWLDIIHLRAPDAPIFIVGTHRHGSAEAPMSPAVLEERLQQIEAALSGHGCEHQLQRDSDGRMITCVDNRLKEAGGDADEVFTALRQRIVATQDGLPDFKASLPVRWLRSLEQFELKAQTQTRMSLSAVREMVKEFLVGDDDAENKQDEVLLMLRTLSDVGLLVHFDEDQLRELVVLRPQWILDTMRSVVCRRNLQQLLDHQADAVPRAALAALYEYGNLNAKLLLPLLWPEIESESERRSLLGYMQSFEFCHPLQGELWQVPSLCEQAQDADVWGCVDRGFCRTESVHSNFESVATSMITHHGDWTLDLQGTGMSESDASEVMSLSNEVPQHSPAFSKATQTIAECWQPHLVTSLYQTLPHGKVFLQQPAKLQVKLKTAFRAQDLVVLKRSRPGAAWRIACEESVHVSTDGRLATVFVRSFSQRALSTVAGLEVPVVDAPLAMEGGLPTPAAPPEPDDVQDWMLAQLDALGISSDDELQSSEDEPESSEAPEPEPEPEPERSSSVRRNDMAQVEPFAFAEPAFVSAYAPTEILPDGNPFLVEIAAYTRAYTAHVAEFQADQGNVATGKKGPLPFPEGSTISITLSLPPEAFDSDDLSPDEFIWDGKYGIAQFIVHCRRSAPQRMHVCQAKIAVDGREIRAVLCFKLKVVALQTLSPPVTPPSERVELPSSSLTLLPPLKPGAQHHIFINYRRSHFELADRVRRQLDSYGYRCFFDLDPETGLGVGEFQGQLEASLTGVPFLLAILTPAPSGPDEIRTTLSYTETVRRYAQEGWTDYCHVELRKALVS